MLVFAVVQNLLTDSFGYKSLILSLSKIIKGDKVPLELYLIKASAVSLALLLTLEPSAFVGNARMAPTFAS